MLPSPPQYSGGFPPRDPRMPSLGRYPQIVGGHDISREAMEAFEERQAPLKQVAYARTGRSEPVRETVETGAGPDEVGEYHEPYEVQETPGVLRSFARGVSTGARHAWGPSQAMGYGFGALGSAITGASVGGVKYLVNRLALSHESESDHEEPEPAHQPVQPEEPRPAYLQDRGPTPKKLSMMEKERIRIREKAAMEGAHPFRPFRPYP